MCGGGDGGRRRVPCNTHHVIVAHVHSTCSLRRIPRALPWAPARPPLRGSHCRIGHHSPSPPNPPSPERALQPEPRAPPWVLLLLHFCIVALPRALPWAPVRPPLRGSGSAMPRATPVASATQRWSPGGAKADSPGHRPGKYALPHYQALKGRSSQSPGQRPGSFNVLGQRPGSTPWVNALGQRPGSTPRVL